MQTESKETGLVKQHALVIPEGEETLHEKM
jgi:hypothetical protein